MADDISEGDEHLQNYKTQTAEALVFLRQALVSLKEEFAAQQGEFVEIVRQTVREELKVQRQYIFSILGPHK